MNENWTAEEVREAESAAQGDVTAMSTALKAIKLRLHFMHWPSEAMWNAGTQEAPIWVPDWRYEIALLEHALHGTPVTVSEKPGDTVPRHSLAAQPHAVPDGWVLVPREATLAMKQAAHEAKNRPLAYEGDQGRESWFEMPERAWTAMLAAAAPPIDAPDSKR